MGSGLNLAGRGRRRLWRDSWAMLVVRHTAGAGCPDSLGMHWAQTLLRAIWNIVFLAGASFLCGGSFCATSTPYRTRVKNPPIVRQTPAWGAANPGRA